MEQGAFKQHKYVKFHDHALAERAKLGPGKSVEMNVLYRFWNFFIRERYTKKMMDEFRELALADAAAGARFVLLASVDSSFDSPRSYLCGFHADMASSACSATTATAWRRPSVLICSRTSSVLRATSWPRVRRKNRT